jgi:hypothetical protein
MNEKPYRRYQVIIYPPNSTIPCKFGYVTDKDGNIQGNYLQNLLDSGWTIKEGSVQEVVL